MMSPLERAHKQLRQEKISLEIKVKKLEKENEQYKAGTFTPQEKLDLLKQLRDLGHQLKEVQDQRDGFKNALMNRENLHLRRTLKEYALTERCDQLMRELENAKDENKRIQKEADEKIHVLEDEVERLKNIINNNADNSGISTAKTPIGQKKRIPNSRPKTDRSIGGQPGHEKHQMDSFNEGEVDTIIDHDLSSCPFCGGGLIQTDAKIRDEEDYELKLVKKRHRFLVYTCMDCGKEVSVPIPKSLWGKNQYSGSIQALALALTNIGFSSFNRSKVMLNGFLKNQPNISEAYICKLQKRAGKKLMAFKNELSNYCCTLPILYWDDTVISINTTRSCMRFYGNESVALYTAHGAKNKVGIDEDGILAKLCSLTKVMHDHNKLNYNKEYSFLNLECNQHLQRDLQSLHDDSSHEWALNVKQLITDTIHERKLLIAEGKESFDDVDAFDRKLDEILLDADQQCASESNRYFTHDEENLITRIREYRENYFSWVRDFSLPTTNNISESALRGIKTHEKVSGQFQSVEYARYFANIRSYIETCSRNGINIFDALTRLMNDRPYTLTEILCGV